MRQSIINGRSIRYDIIGQGRPVLFVHGWGGNIDSLRKVAAMNALTRRSILVELPGFGKSDLPGAGWGVGEYAGFIAVFLKSLGISRIDYFGHSFGGSLGIYLSLHYPTLIDKLILCGSAFRRQGKTNRPTRQLHGAGERILFLRPLIPIVRRIYYRIFFPDSDLYRFPKLESNFRKIMTEDLSGRVGEIDKPALILWGDRDTYTPLPLAYELKSKIRNSRLQVLNDVGHNLPKVEPDWVYQQMDKFL